MEERGGSRAGWGDSCPLPPADGGERVACDSSPVKARSTEARWTELNRRATEQREAHVFTGAFHHRLRRSDRGLAYAASLAGVATPWIAVGAVVLLGLGIMVGVTRTRQRDP